jgi:ATP-binding cassette subfamily B protein
MLLTDPVLTAWCIAPIAIGGVYMRLTVRRFYALVRDSLDSLARLSDRVLESYAGIVTIRAHAAEEAALARFDQRNQAYLDIQHRIATMRAFSMPVLGFSGLLGTGTVLLVGGQRVMAGEMMIGAMATFTALLVSLVSLLTSLAWVLASVSRGMIAMGRVEGLLSAVDDDPLGTRPVRLDAPPAISIRGLSFTYPGADAPSLAGVDVELPAGKTLGIFGKTGSGKSTLVALLARTWVPTPGQIFLDGDDLATLDRRVLRERVAIVPQSPFLFSTTVRENIRLVGERPPDLEADARSDAAITDREAVRRAVEAEPDARLREVLEDVTLMEDVVGLPRGLDTVVGERGVILSGGQRQRAALARALYKRPTLLLLDDVLSAVDQSTEARLVAAIRGIAGAGEGEASSPTTVIVSNRTSVLEHADLVLVLDAGKVVDRGTHAELAARPGIYAAAHQQQTKGRRRAAGPARGQAGLAPASHPGGDAA